MKRIATAEKKYSLLVLIFRARQKISLNICCKRFKMKSIAKAALFGLLMMLNTSFVATESTKNMVANYDFKKLHTLKWHNGSIWSMTTLKNGMLVSGSADTFVGVWIIDGVCTQRLNNNYSEVVSVCELVDGR